MSSPIQDSSNAAYVRFNVSASRVQGAGAAALSALMVISCWGRWSAMLAVGLIQGLVVVFNVLLVNERLLREWGIVRAELLRTVVNVATGLIANHISQWPLASWLFLPYVALVFDHFNSRVAYGVLVSHCAFNAALAVHDGVAWRIPAAFSALAVFCCAMSRVRYDAIRAMAIDADMQRREAEAAHEQLVTTESKLRQAQKLEAVGRLASGVAHEINTPVQFVSDSVTFVAEGVESVLRVLAAYHAKAPGVEELETELDIPFIAKELPGAVSLAREGLDRVATIVRSMRHLAHPDRAEMELGDINHAITMATTLAASECRPVADVETDLGDVPNVLCFVGEIGQVVLNLVVNAAQALASAPKKPSRGKITISSRATASSVVITVGDNGPGIPSAIQERIFEPFFTTKDVGKGTGQGLALAHATIAKHHGALTFETGPRGTTFRIEIPRSQSAQAA
ncbi:MAG TPA: HAMP domain-containing sensor histidine kinase [Polyangiaceae bacterium]